MTESEAAKLSSSNAEDIKAVLFLLTKELAYAIAHLIKTEFIPPLSETADGTNCGGACMLFWSAGIAFLASLLANFASLDDETQALLAADYEIGEVMRQRIIQRAVLFFTGEALDEDDDFDDEDEEDEDEMDDEEDSENDSDFDPAAAAVAAAKGGKGGKGKKNPDECKQQ